MIELTNKQAQALDYFIKGLSMKEIALRLGISYSRVINVLNSILIKTGYQNRKQLFQDGKNIEYTIKN